MKLNLKFIVFNYRHDKVKVVLTKQNDALTISIVTNRVMVTASENERQ